MKSENRSKSELIEEIDRLQSQVKKLETSEMQLQVLNKKLHHSEKRYRSIFENTGTITLLFNKDTTITMVNSDFANRMGYSKEEVEGKKSWTEFVAKDDLERLVQSHKLRSLDPGAAPRNHEFKVINKKGEVLNIFMTIDIIPGTTERIASLIDITDKVKAEKEIMNISERERQTIGQDLHDDLAPQLIGIEVLTEVLKKKVEKSMPREVNDIERIKGLIQDAITKTRSYARGLCPIHIIDYGLGAALKELTAYIETVHNVSCSLQYEDEIINDRIKDIAVLTNLYYLTQETVHNAVKHGNAKNIDIRLSHTNKTVQLIIKDDGCGFNPGSDTEGMGQKIMKYRANIIEAILTIESKPGDGTTVTVIL